MGRHKSNGAGTYKSKLYYKEEELKVKFDKMFGLMDETNQRVIRDPPCRGSIPLLVVRKAIKKVVDERKKSLVCAECKKEIIQHPDSQLFECENQYFCSRKCFENAGYETIMETAYTELRIEEKENG